MSDPKIDIKQFALKEEQAAKAWLGTNLVPFAVGASCGLVLGWLVHIL